LNRNRIFAEIFVLTSVGILIMSDSPVGTAQTVGPVYAKWGPYLRFTYTKCGLHFIPREFQIIHKKERMNNTIEDETLLDLEGDQVVEDIPKGMMFYIVILLRFSCHYINVNLEFHHFLRNS
jgi:hypothetical protein